MTPKGQKHMQTGLCCGHVKRYHLEDLGIDGKIITQLTESRRYGVNRIHVALDRSSASSREHDNETYFRLPQRCS